MSPPLSATAKHYPLLARASDTSFTLVQFLIITAAECGGRRSLAEEGRDKFSFPLSLREMELGAGFARKQEGSPDRGSERAHQNERREGGIKGRERGYPARCISREIYRRLQS